MRNMLLGGLVGLLIGTAATFAYEVYSGTASQLTNAQSDLAASRQSLAQSAVVNRQLKNEIDAISAQLQHSLASNDKLKDELSQAQKAPVASTAAATNKVDPVLLSKINDAFFRLKSRLKLTPEQEAAVRAELDALAHHTNGSKSLDQLLNEILDHEQQTAYQQLKDDSKKSEADNAANAQTNQVAMMFQLSDAQKNQVYAALDQIQLNGQLTATAHPTDMNAFLEAQIAAKEAALSKILTPEQLAIYAEQLQAQLQIQNPTAHTNVAGMTASWEMNSRLAGVSAK